MRSGRLNRRLIVQELAAGSPRQSSSGERADPWTTIATIRGYIRPLSGKEIRAADQAQSSITTEIEIRHTAEIAAVLDAGRALRCTHGSVVYTVHAGLDPERRGRKLLLQCSSGVVNDEVTTA